MHIFSHKEPLVATCTELHFRLWKVYWLEPSNTVSSAFYMLLHLQ